MFQAGIDRKIIKEFTGHVSDAVEKYQVTSDAPREHLSDVLYGQNSEKITNEECLCNASDQSNVEVQLSRVKRVWEMQRNPCQLTKNPMLLTLSVSYWKVLSQEQQKLNSRLSSVTE